MTDEWHWMDAYKLRGVLARIHPGDPRKPSLERSLFIRETFVHG